MNSRSDTGTESMIDHLAVDVATAVTKEMPADDRSLEGAVRVAFKCGMDGMSREILTDREPSTRDRVAN